ncbi:hypothetical protein V3C99_017717 [Haemonchus contortus]|uniref:VWFA domain-containing protein n=1 Tax=Haemonchus contortus TaxID=6289 RepID=A0A7I4Z495_HAECO
MHHKLLLLCLSFSLFQLSLAQQDDETCPPVLDIAFVLDTSGSIEEIYNEQVRWTVSLTDALPIAQGAVRLSTIQYAGYPLTEFSLDTYNDKGEVERHLREMSFQSGVTRTGYALRRAEDELFNEDRGARSKNTHTTPKQRVSIHSAEATTAAITATEIFERVLKSVGSAYNSTTYSTTSTTAVRVPPWKPRKPSDMAVIKNKPRTKKIRKIIRRKLKRVPGISRKDESRKIMFTSTTMNPMQFLRTTKAITNIPDITFSSQNQSPPSTLPFTHEGIMERKRAFASKTTLFDEKSTAFPTPHEGSVGVPLSFVPRTAFDKPESAMFPTPHEGAVGTPRAFAPKTLQGNALRHRPEVTVPPVPSTEAPRIRPTVTVLPVASKEAPRIRPTITVPPVPSTGAPRILAPVLAPLPLATRVSQTDGGSRGKCPLDILFIVDSSGSVGEIYEKQKVRLVLITIFFVRKGIPRLRLVDCRWQPIIAHLGTRAESTINTGPMMRCIK